MSNDVELLRRYVDEGSESAFTDLVHEHVNLVYSAALREMNGETGLAEDVSQAVFTELARKAPRLLRHPSLAGWLYVAVRNLSANLRRSEQSRRRREEEASNMNEPQLEGLPDKAWRQVEPVLDDALHELSEADREAIVIRFLEDRTLREVGERLGLNENAARMRVDRALEKLRVLLERRGITSTAGGLAAALAAGAVIQAPAALGASIASAALATGTVAGSTTLAILKIMSVSKLKVGLIGAVVVAGVAVPAWQQTRLNDAQTENEQLRAQETELTVLREEVGQLRNVQTDQAELGRLRQYQEETQPELLRLRGMAGLARRANTEAEQLRAQLAKKQAAEAGTNSGSGIMAEAMKQAMEQQMEGRLSRMITSLKLTPEQAEAVRSILARQTELMSAGMQQGLSGKIDKEALAKMGKEAGNSEEQIKALLTPEQQAAYQDYQQEENAYNARIVANGELLQLQGTLGLTAEQQDRAFAALYDVTVNQMNPDSMKALSFTNPAAQVRWVLDQKTKALEPILTPAQMEGYRRQMDAQAKLIENFMGGLQNR